MKNNCYNCGAPLHYDQTSYGKTAKCEYCNTEYHIDMLGRVEEYKVKLKMYNKIISFYLGSMTFEPVIIDTYRDISGRLSYTTIDRRCPDITLELHSYDWEDIKDE